MTVIINNNPVNQRKLLMRYSAHLLKLEGENRDKFSINKSKCKSSAMANQVTSGVAITSGGAGIVTGITVVGLPISIGLAGVSLVTGLASGIITTVGRNYQKNAIRYQKKVILLSQARIKLNTIIVSTYEGTLLSNEKVAEAMEIYSTVLKKVNQLNLNDLESINLDTEAGLERYTTGLESIRDQLAK